MVQVEGNVKLVQMKFNEFDKKHFPIFRWILKADIWENPNFSQSYCLSEKDGKPLLILMGNLFTNR